MFLCRLVLLCALVAVAISGCRTAPPLSGRYSRVSPPVVSSASEPAPDAAEPTVQTIAFQESLPASDESVRSVTGPQAELSLPNLTDEVLNRNPSLQAMAAAWQAAAQRYPQVVSLEDPMFSAMAAPASFNSDDVESAYVLQAGQKFPWFGKRAARGRMAQAETNAAFEDLADSRLRLTEAAQIAFYEYFLVHRQLELNQENTDVIRQFGNTAQTRYKANQVTQQDVLQADLELAQQERRRIELSRNEKIAAARINTLLREPPYAPLPPPPKKLDVPGVQTDREFFQQLALDQRPDLRALAAKLRAEQAAVTLACKEYYPDVEVFGRYDTFWQPAETQSDLRGQVGVNVNVPLYGRRLNAAVREAMFRVRQRRSEYEQRILDVQYEVAAAYEQLEESRKTLQLYGEKLIPAAQQNVAAARSNYDVSKTTFLDLATAQRQLITLREDRETTLAVYHKRLAELMRVVGGADITDTSTIEVQPLSLPVSQ
jgi:cobalt-zinc-cadmium efflux system outer membrane protein